MLQFLYLFIEFHRTSEECSRERDANENRVGRKVLQKIENKNFKLDIFILVRIKFVHLKFHESEI